MPGNMLNWFKKKFLSKNEKVFYSIYESNIWKGNESVSGPGSDLDQVAFLIPALQEVLSDLKVKSFLDLPCGDFNWMKMVDLKGIEYLGGDLVKPIIKRNEELYESPHIQFKVIDITKDELNQVDLILVRDCLVHLSFQDIFKAINNVLKSDSTYLMSTSFVELSSNTDIETGGWRPLNLELPPFNFPKPYLLINERCTENNGMYADKSLGIWKISDLKKLKF